MTNAIKEVPETIEGQEEILQKYDSESRFRKIDHGFWRWAIFALSVGLAGYHLYTAYFGPLDALRHRSLHTAIIAALVFILYPAFYKKGSKKVTPIDMIWMAAALATGGYMIIDYQGIAERMSIYMPSGVDIAFGLLTIAVVIEGGRRVAGNALTILTVLFLLYAFFGQYFPDLFKHSGKDLEDIVTYMYLSTEGIYGIAISVSASYIILFILFGAFLNRSGMGQFFTDISLSIAGHTSGGPAKVAVVSSGLLGSINGSALANVVTTGAFTIPLMKRVGYKPEFAGAVEATASVGGQIIPPVMGATAFIMAETLGMPYNQIALAAILPAFLYYLGIICIVHFRAKKLGLRGMSKEELPNLWQVFKKGGHLLIPIVVLIGMLIAGKTPLYAAFYAIVLSIVVSWFNKETRMGPKEILGAMEDGVRSALGVAMSCAMVGLIVGVSTLTGLGPKLTQSILVLGQGDMFLTLVFTMIACIIMGMGLPSIPTYIITATMAAPALLELGVAPFVTHMFVFYFGILANVTPPVALAAFAGAGIAGASPNKTGFEALRLALSGFIIPYIFVFSPVILMQDVTSPLEVAWVAATAIIGILGLSAALERYLIADLPLPLAALCLAGSVTLIIPGMWTDIIGLGILALVFIQQLLARSKARPDIPTSKIV
ncbi:TRAP transporter permease [Pseudobacillus badius]|uniref:TRAP transporter permease n=1 Tax=Bacillus badius TaxID=1455 RepID=UPI0007B04938|nr:TRAP transporter permease [Bacillus badius]KZN98510.1 C4-dicarboxylate ABC transporter permease [Bacillus badius]MED0666168.1 TRAP transporter permease [Bacillus badius]OCS83207.1 C4-dicarboxylate ABC transporter permease [Bacillus badius]OVE51583.1 C4-dicarboxylate ABC transporter permease [Bacillus badius]TDW02827.1 TRAP transporter 4TM/12TM fusion protein [Bacillus badius]